jgi:ABC-type Mn2+/Zn2+ transport system permease subunit
MEWLTEPFASELARRALLASALTVVTTSLVGTWVVVRGLSFLGDALAHGVLPGIAVATLWGIDPTVGAMAAAAVMVVGIGVVHRQARLTEDTGIGLLFVGLLALGVVIISREDSFAADLTAVLFGDVLGVTGSDLAVQAAAAATVLVAVTALYRPFLVLSFNPQKAELLGLRPRLAHAALLGLVALAVVSSFRAVGTLLVFGLLVAPPATALLLVRRLPLVMAVGVALGLMAVVVGLVVSYHLDTAAAATVATTSVAGFFAVVAGRAAFGRP